MPLVFTQLPFIRISGYPATRQGLIVMENIRKPLKTGISGFTLVELMVTVGIVAILMALAIPNYAKYVRKANRGEAQQLMLNYANLQEIWRSNNLLYATSAQLGLPTHDKFNFFVRAAGITCANAAPTAANYSVVACVKSGDDQAKDKQEGIYCTPMGLDQSNGKFDASNNITQTKCW